MRFFRLAPTILLLACNGTPEGTSPGVDPDSERHCCTNRMLLRPPACAMGLFDTNRQRAAKRTQLVEDGAPELRLPVLTVLSFCP